MARALIVTLLAAVACGANAAEVFRYTENNNDGDNVALGFPVPQPQDAALPGDYFRSYDFLLARHQAMALDNDEIESHVIGETRKGEDIWAYVLGDDDGVTAEYGMPEGAVLINGGIHAREWQSPESVSFLMEHLAAIRNDDGVGRYLADNLNVIVIPVLNVDGFRQTQRHWDRVTDSVQIPRDGRMRRKNMFHPSGSTVDTDLESADDNLHGVDLNRNNRHGFGLNGGSETDPESLIYHGDAPASETEIRALQAAAALGPESQLRMYTDAHSFSQLYFVPQTGDSARDAYTRYLVRLKANASRIGYAVVPESPGTPIGTTADYFAYTFNIPSWTLELEPRNSGAVQYGSAGVSHDGFILPESEVARMREDSLGMHLAGLYAQAGPPAVVAVEIRDAATDEIRYAARWRHDNDNARTLIVADDRALVSGRTYVAQVRFDKPMVDIDAQKMGAGTDGLSARLFLAGLDPGAQDTIVALNDSEPEWLENADDSHRYRGDTLRVTFGVDDTFAGATRVALAIDAVDFNGTALDADPATPAVWRNGSFDRHDSFPGDGNVSSAFGGVDCNFRPFVADDADASAPAPNDGDCAFWKDARAAAGQDTKDALLARISGGGALSPWFVLFGLLLRPRRRRMA